MIHSFRYLIFSVLLLGACREAPPQLIRIGINPWPGYEFLYLAEQKEFYQEEGLNVKIVHYSSLEDVLRALKQGQIDGMGSTVIELIQVTRMGKAAKIVMVSDYSHGADVIVTRDHITQLSQLRGMRVGLEFQSVGIFMLARALDKAGLSLDDVKVLNMPQLEMARAFEAGEIDVAITYPPTSMEILAQARARVLFDSSAIPGEVLDVISLDASVLASQPELQGRLFKVWDRALAYAASNKAEAYAIMAQREQITPAAFEGFLEGITILDSADQASIFHSKLEEAILLAEETLLRLGLIEPSKKKFSYIYRGN